MTVIYTRLFFPRISCCSFYSRLSNSYAYRSREKLTKTSYSNIPNPKACFKLHMYFNSHAHSLKTEISTRYSDISSNPRKWHKHSSLGIPQYRKYTGKDLLDYSVIAVTPYRYVHIPTMAHDGKNLFISSLIGGHSYLLVFQHCPSSSITFLSS